MFNSILSSYHKKVEISPKGAKLNAVALTGQAPAERHLKSNINWP